MRINKFLAAAGVGSRRNVEALVKTGRVQVNGETTRELATDVDPRLDEVKLDGKPLRLSNRVYYAMNKPKEVVVSVADDRGRTTVVDLLDAKERVFPVGRLDYNTTGVLLLTNDGDFANALTHPSNEAPRVYKATLDRRLEDEDRRSTLAGVRLKDGVGKFVEIKPGGSRGDRWIVSCHEGRNHFVKRMFHELGYRVRSLERLSFGGITAKGLAKGEYRALTKKEIEYVYREYGS
jgi:23S rRNA pseudouridine2605 synthase